MPEQPKDAKPPAAESQPQPPPPPPPPEAAAPPSEKPVASAKPKTSEYVVTIDDATGATIKIEKLSEGGTRKELTPEEYSGAAAYVSGLASQYYTASSPTPYSSQDIAAARAYYQGVVDYLDALSSSGSLT